MHLEMKTGKKKIIFIISAAIAVIIIASIAFFMIGTGSISSDNSKKVTVEITQGSGSYDIINALDEAGLIKSTLAAKVYVRLFGPETLQANTYVLNKTMNLSDMLEIIGSGNLKYVLKSEFTIIEGATYKDASASIAKALNISQSDVTAKWSDKDFLKTLIDEYWFLEDDILESGILCPLEGYLYPNTYFITDKEPTIESVTKQILKETDKKLSEVKADIKESKYSIHDLLTLASVVENESLYTEDKNKIAGVFVNRLKTGMKLQSDITVLYALGEKRVNVSIADTQVDSKYNTYLHEGLPVGPVSNPSLDTIKACLDYEETDYLYFFATEEGKVIYSKTYEDHLKAVEKYGWY